MGLGRGNEATVERLNNGHHWEHFVPCNEVSPTQRLPVISGRGVVLCNRAAEHNMASLMPKLLFA